MDLVTIEDLVMARPRVGAGLPPMRWAVIATFARVGDAELRCVDYRVRVVPETPRASGSVREGHRVLRAMRESTVSKDEVAQLGAIPREGIPRHVFEQASQANLLKKARAKATRRPDRVSAAARKALQSAGEPRTGRPPKRTLAEKLKILSDAEQGFDAGETRSTIARRHAMSDSSLRDLLTWARRDTPPLWASHGPGRRGGVLTSHARALLAGLEEGQNHGEH